MSDKSLEPMSDGYYRFQVDKVTVQIKDITLPRAKRDWEDAKRAIDAFFSEVTRT